MNVRSVRNKTHLVHEEIIKTQADIAVLTETWLTGSGEDDPVIAELLPAGYNFHNLPRLTGRGGGIGIVYMSELDVRILVESSVV